MIEFPTNYFPTEIEEFINECSDKNALNKEYMCGAALSLLSILIGNKIKLKVSATQIESAMLWICIVGSSGTKKTPSINTILKPIEQIDNLNYKAYLRKNSDYKADPENNDKPFFYQKVVDDATMESLNEMMYFNKHGLLMKKDELLSLIYDGKRYKGNSGMEQRLLSIYSQSSFAVNRKSDDEVKLISNPFLSLIGGIQPSLCNELLSDKRMNNGFVNRLLFIYPTSYIAKLPKGEFDETIKDNFDEFVEHLNSRIEAIEATTIPLNTSAKKRFYAWQEEFVLPIINDDSESELMKATISKFEATVLRIALILECSHSLNANKIPNHVSKTSINASIEIIEYFKLNFLELLRTIRNESETINPKIHQCLQYFAKDVLKNKNIEKSAYVANLLCNGYSNSVINKALGIPKSTISGYK